MHAPVPAEEYTAPWIIAEFEKLYQQQAHDLRPVDQELDDDARKATEAP
jgi:hypothetical protein